MYLKELRIDGFRRLSDFRLRLQPGLNLILGENNVGKSTVSDAIRLLVDNSTETYRVTVDDFQVAGKERRQDFTLSAIFGGLTGAEQGAFLEALVLNAEGAMDAHIHLRFELDQNTEQVRRTAWFGEREGRGSIQEFQDLFRFTYLPPLRDPNVGLRPGRQSQVANLLTKLVPPERRGEFEAIANDANDALANLGPVGELAKILQENLQSITGAQMAQKPSVDFSPHEFRRIVSNLRARADDMEITQNGLGFNNLFFIATVIGNALNERKDTYRAILVEEPEAHLHPQLQAVLLRFLSASASAEAGLQIFLTSHSPIVASQTDVRAINTVRARAQEITASPLAALNLADRPRRKLQRYLDATRSELFFAQRLIFVEGLSEALLVPVLAKCLPDAVDLHDYATTLVNASGLDFQPFIDLFSGNAPSVPVAVLTDCDPPKDAFPALGDTAQPSASVGALKGRETSNIRVFHGLKTFEYDLALESGNLVLMMDALRTMHPDVGKGLDKRLQDLTGQAAAKEFFSTVFISRTTSKPEFAQILAELIEDEGHRFVVPGYIANAIHHACGIVVEPTANESA